MNNPIRMEVVSLSEDTLQIQILLTEKVQLQAFTFSVSYDTNCYELYKANDELPGGYGFSEQFSSSYENNGGMIIAGDVPGKVTFSGVCTKENTDTARSVLATIYLNTYRKDIDKGPVVLDITALGINGEMKSFQPGELSNNYIPQKENPISGENPGSNQEENSHLETDVIINGDSGRTEETEDVFTGNTPPDTILPTGTATSEDFVTNTGVKIAETGKENPLPNTNVFILLSCILLLSIVLWITIKKRKIKTRRSDKS